MEGVARALLWEVQVDAAASGDQREFGERIQMLLALIPEVLEPTEMDESPGDQVEPSSETVRTTSPAVAKRVNATGAAVREPVG